MFKALLRLLRALFDILSSRKLLLLAMLPWGIGIGLFVGIITIGSLYSVTIGGALGLDQYVPSWLAGMGVAVASVILASVTAALGVVGLSSLLLEPFMGEVLGIPESKEAWSLRTTLLPLLAGLAQTALLLAVGIVALLLSLIPLFTLPALALAAFAAGADLALSALLLQRCEFRHAVRLVLRHPLQVITLGGPLLIPFPLLPIALLPVSAHAAATLSKEWLSQRRTPEM